MAVTLACAAALAAGCSIGGDPEQASTVLPSTGPPTSERTLAPPITTPAPQFTRQSAAAAAVNFVRVLNDAYLTWDTTDLAAIIDPHVCVFCQKVVTELPQARAQGYTHSGGRITIRGAPRFDNFDTRAQLAGIELPVSIAALVVHDPHGRLYVSAADPKGGGPAHPRWLYGVALQWEHSAWKITGLDGSTQ